MLAAGLLGAALTLSVATTGGWVSAAGAQVLVDEPPTIRVESASHLNCVLRSPFKGRVVVPAGVEWPMVGDDDCDPATPDDKPLISIPIQAGVQLIGERGPLGSRPVLSTDYRGENHPGENNRLFLIEDGDNQIQGDIQVEGLHLVGPYLPQDRKQKLEGVMGIEVVEDAAQQRGRRILIADNEIAHFTNAVDIKGTIQEDEPGVYDRACKPPGATVCPHLEPGDAGLLRVERNYLHHNAMKGGGYGIVVGGGAYVTAEGNVFEFNNHSMAASGRAYSGYVARFNYVLRGVLTNHAGKNPHAFDVHGRGGGGQHAGGRAGTYFQIALNTFLFEGDYAFKLRGTPTQGAYFRGNVVVHDDVGEAVALERGDRIHLPTSARQFNFHEGGNRFDADHSSDLATGDFDGDGLGDVFVANGTGWFFSRAGLRPWEFLRPSTKRTEEIGFADVTGDRVTDILYRDGRGRLGYLRSGMGNLVALPSPPVPVPMKDLRFGDFDGDRLTDLFYTYKKQWQVWYGATRTWRPAQTSSKPISELLFGEFDDIPGTDVVGVNSSGWAYSSAATAGWRPLNRRRSSSFADAIAADVDGSAKTDIVFGGKRGWRYSREGRSALLTLRGGSGTLSRLQVGRFDGVRDGFVSFGYAPHRDRLGLWLSRGAGRGSVMHSEQNMR